MTDFKFAIGDVVGALNETTYGPVVERLLHEFAGGSRRKYYYHARTKLPNGIVIPAMLLEGFEEELKIVGIPWPEWHLPPQFRKESST